MKTFIALSQLKGHGGIPRFNQNLIDAISTQHDVSLLSLNDASSVALNGANRNKLLFLFKFFRMLLSRPEVIILGHLNLLPALLLKFMTKAKVVVLLHGIDAWSPKKGSDKFYEKVDEFWSVSQYTKDQFCKVSGVKTSKVRKIFNTLPKEWELMGTGTEDKKFFLTVTRVDKSEGYKGVDKTIEAIANLKDRFRENGWKFKTVLSGDDVQKHKDLAVSLDIKDLVEFQSGITDEKLQAMYADCSAFILPSNGEGFGIVFLEAMSYGKPCIGARNCGSEDVIDHEHTGFLIDPTVEVIQKSISTLIENESLRTEMGENGFDKLKREFIFDKFEQTINDYLIACVG